MQATITYLLSEQAQRAAMAATGQPVARKQTITEDIPNAWMTSPLVAVTETGDVVAKLDRSWGISDQGNVYYNSPSGYANVYGDFDHVPASGLAALEEVRGRIEAKASDIKRQYEERQRARNEEIAAARAKVAAEMAADPEAIPDLPYCIGQQLYPESVERQRRVALREARKKAAEEAKEQAKRDYITAWLSEHATPEVQEQHTAGLLARTDALAMIADSAFAAVGVPEEHEVTICESSGCPCGSNDVDTIPATVYARWKPIKVGLPEGTVVEFEKSRDCLQDEDGYAEDGENASKPYYTATVKMPVGPFTFERRIKL